MTSTDPRDIELDLVIAAIHRRYGYDFRDYARVSLERRVRHRMKIAGMESMLEMLPRILYDADFARSLMDDLSITVTEMFRDPAFYQAFRDKVVPVLETYPFVKIWHAGCATGEEVYSMAIVLHEEGFLDRVQLYATDFNQHALDMAKEGIYRIEDVHKATMNYNKTGPKGSFRDYYHAKYRSAIVARFLRENIVFAHHNLVTDSVFATMNAIICRNVMIYFNRDLQDRVLRLFRDSLCRRGFLALGTKETLEFSAVSESFESIAQRQRIYRLR